MYFVCFCLLWQDFTLFILQSSEEQGLCLPTVELLLACLEMCLLIIKSLFWIRRHCVLQESHRRKVVQIWWSRRQRNIEVRYQGQLIRGHEVRLEVSWYFYVVFALQTALSFCSLIFFMHLCLMISLCCIFCLCIFWFVVFGRIHAVLLKYENGSTETLNNLLNAVVTTTPNAIFFSQK